MTDSERQDQARADLYVLLILDGETVKEALRLAVHHFPEV